MLGGEFFFSSAYTSSAYTSSLTSRGAKPLMSATSSWRVFFFSADQAQRQARLLYEEKKIEFFFAVDQAQRRARAAV